MMSDLKTLVELFNLFCMQNMEGPGSATINIIWPFLSNSHISTLNLQVTVMHSMSAGYMDKAQKYTDKALMQIEKLKSK